MANRSVVVAKTRLHRLWGGNGKRDAEERPDRDVALSHESCGLYSGVES